MTLEEATEAGLLVAALKDLGEELSSLGEVVGPKIGFEDDLYLPRALFIAMTEFGLSYARARLAELGVTVPEEPKA